MFCCSYFLHSHSVLLLQFFIKCWWKNIITRKRNFIQLKCRISITKKFISIFRLLNIFSSIEWETQWREFVYLMLDHISFEFRWCISFASISFLCGLHHKLTINDAEWNANHYWINYERRKATSSKWTESYFTSIGLDIRIILPFDISIGIS